MTAAPGPRIADLGVSALDALVVLAAASTPHPWSRAQFADELRRPQARVTAAFVDDGVAGEAVAAYVAWWHIVDEVEILDVATHPRWRRRGLARDLVQEVLTRARAQGATRAFLEVRASNQAAQALYRGLGFVDSGCRKGYYAAEGEDALLMCCPLAG